MACSSRSLRASAEVRDSKDQGGPVLAFDPAAWRTFIASTSGTTPQRP
ncbi:DUF397 domain-containing protein [Plantactinospora soyae]